MMKVNKPVISHFVRECLKENRNVANLGQITDYVMAHMTVHGKTPRNTIASVVYRMRDIQRVAPARYVMIQ